MSFLRRFFREKTQAQPSNKRFEVEYCPPVQSGLCDCCGGRTTTLNRLVKRDGLPVAICRITFSEGHLDEPARAIVGIGEFGEGTHPNQRVAFGISLKPEGVMLIDATRSEWADLEILGHKLTREQALGHALKPELFRLFDELYSGDDALRQLFSAVVRDG